MKLKKGCICSALLISAFFLLTACEKVKKDEIANELEAIAGTDTSDDNAVEKDAVSEIPDTISYSVVSRGWEIKVDAQIYADGYGNVPTFAVTECENRDELVLKYAEKLFDKGEFDNIKPHEVASREELEKEIQFYEERFSGNNKNSQNWYLEYIEWVLENFDDSKYVEYPDENIVYEIIDNREYTVEGNGDIVTEEQNAQNYDCVVTYKSRLRGYVNGKLWIMNYYDGYDEFVMGEEKHRNEDIPYLEAYCIDENYPIIDTLGMDEAKINNLCDRESAEGQAKQFLSGLGMDNMELLHIVHNEIRLNEETSAVDGYTMIFGMSENGAHLLFSYGACETNMKPTNEQNIFATQPYVEVRVNSKGVCGIVIRGNYNDPELMSEKTTMLSFEQINEIAKEKLPEIKPYHIGCIEFGYLYITYDGLSYAIVPAWRYYETQNKRNTIANPPVLTICALDGSVIYNDNLGVYPPYTGNLQY